MTSAVAAGPSAPRDPTLRRPLLSQADGCELHHRGLLLDFAAESTQSDRGFVFGTPAPRRTVERAGVQLLALEASQASLDFWWWHPSERLELTALLRPETAERVSFSIDGRNLGTVKTKPGELQQVTLPLRDWALDVGRHKLTVALPRGRRTTSALELAWVRLGTTPQGDVADQPVGRSEALSEVTIGGKRQRAVVLRDGGAFRCPLWLASRAGHISGSIGLWGKGEAEAELWAERVDGSEQLLHSVRIEKDGASSWLPFDVDLTPFSDSFVSLSWRAPRVDPSARLAVGEPTLVEPAVDPTSTPRARRALLFVLSGLSQADSPPHAAAAGLPVLQQLAAEATRFPGYRASSTSPQAIVASLLSGTAPWQHGLGEQDRVWPRTIPRLSEWVEAAGGQTAFFTGVPHSFQAFGFAQGFEVFEEISPVLDLGTIEPIRRAKSWLLSRLQQPNPLLCVLHLRGGHPPFDVNHDTALELPPAEYGGDLDPRRAAIQLLSIRSRSRPAGRVLPDEDWTRLLALRKKALLDQSAAIGALFQTLRETNAWDDSLIIVVGDAGTATRPDIPFDEHAPLEEALLSVPLFVKFPGKHLAGRPVAGSFSPRDVLATITTALGLPAPPGSIDLGSARAEHDAREQAHVAFREGRYATRLGPYLLRGQSGRVPQLCRVDLDPSCSLDRFASDPLAARILWLETYRALARSDESEKHEPLTENAELEAALTVWGVIR